jgi:hypothetical protein
MRTPQRIDISKVLSIEIAATNFGDFRLSRRLQLIMSSIASHPAESFPKIFSQRCELDGFYRFVNNDRVEYTTILEPHILGTKQRVDECESTVIIHDTTDFAFANKDTRENLGLVTANQQGFFGHFSLAIDESNQNPLGLLAVSPFFREGTGKRNRTQEQRRKDGDSEFLRWQDHVKQCDDLVADSNRAIHVTDREADAYSLVSEMVDANIRFVVRSKYDRKLLEETLTLWGVREVVPMMFEREVKLSSRRKNKCKQIALRHPPRDRRLAKLGFRAKSVVVNRPRLAEKTLLDWINLNVIFVEEIDPPADAEPIEWILITSEPVENQQQVARIVDIYRMRWNIEEYFKALKTGCAYEKRQLESRESLMNLLAIMAPVAWQLLSIRRLAESFPEKDSRLAFNKIQLQILSKKTKKPLEKLKNIYDAVLALAQIGGHQRRAGPPGWLVLGRGLEELLSLEAGWRLATCDGR